MTLTRRDAVQTEAPVSEFAGNLRRIVAPNPSAMTYKGTNTYLIGRSRIAVIDPGPNDDQHFRRLVTLAESSGQITKIFITHPHVDHIALVPRLVERTGAEVLAHSGTDGAISGRMSEIATGGSLGGGEGLGLGFEPDRRLEDGEVVSCEEWSIEAVWTPGHTANHLCFAWSETESLFSGDHVMGWSTTIVSPPHGDMGDYMRSLDRLKSRSERIYYPGHGEPVMNPAEEVQSQFLHRLSREEEIIGCLRRGMTESREVAGMIYPDAAASIAAAAERNVLAHLLDLQLRGVVSRTDGKASGRLFFRILE